MGVGEIPDDADPPAQPGAGRDQDSSEVKPSRMAYLVSSAML